jgi:hypothetical protein
MYYENNKSLAGNAKIQKIFERLESAHPWGC